VGGLPILLLSGARRSHHQQPQVRVTPDGTTGVTRQMGSIIVGVPLLLVGFSMYLQYAPQWQLSQSLIGQLAQALSSDLREQVQTVQLYLFLSVALMVVGGIFVLNGLLQRLLEDLRRGGKQK
jgi:hypothetical protein